MSNKTSSNILSAAANLLGFCLFVITSLHVSNKYESTLIDEFASVVTLLLSFSCLFSFFSIKTIKVDHKILFEKVAEVLFITSLVGIVILVFLLVLGTIK
jgi:hypothetical protein